VPNVTYTENETIPFPVPSAAHLQAGILPGSQLPRLSVSSVTSVTSASSVYQSKVLIILIEFLNVVKYYLHTIEKSTPAGYT
jgi:hypothetical protein